MPTSNSISSISELVSDLNALSLVSFLIFVYISAAILKKSSSLLSKNRRNLDTSQDIIPDVADNSTAST